MTAHLSSVYTTYGGNKVFTKKSLSLFSKIRRHKALETNSANSTPYSLLNSLKSVFRGNAPGHTYLQYHQVIKNRFPGPIPNLLMQKSQEGSQQSLLFKKQAYSPLSLTNTILYIIQCICPYYNF